MKNLRKEVDSLGLRLERDFRDRVGRAGGGFSAGGSNTKAGFEILLSRGKIYELYIPYARRTRKLGPLEQIRDLSDVERELREAIESWFKQTEQQIK